MRTRFLAFSLLAALLPFAPCAIAQDDAEKPPITLGDFAIHGSATGGYRFETVKGFEPQFLQMFDLKKGFRLFDFDLSGNSEIGKNAFADDFSLQLSGLGGDPFPTAQFTISKKKLYDLRVDWRQSYYYWNQNDTVALPLSPLATISGHGLTSNHDWATVRKFGFVDLTIHATNNLRFNFYYYRPSDEGNTFTTRSLDFLNSPSYWGSFARANPYFLLAPLSDYTNRFTGGIDYTHNSWNFHYNVGYQTFTENIDLNNLTTPQVSINPIPSSANQPLTTLSWSQFRKLTTPISEFSFLGKPVSRLEWRGGYMFYRYDGPATFDQSFNGIAPNAAGVLTPYAISQSGRVTVTQPNHIIDQGLTLHLFNWWSLDLQYRYSRFTSDSVGNFSSLFNGTTPSTAVTDVIWRDGISDLRFTMDFMPFPSLILRPGVQLLKADVESFTNGLVDPGRTLQTKTASPVISFGYEPSRKLTFRGDFHNTVNGASYTAITPHTQQGGRVIVHYQPFARLSFDNEFGFANNKLLDSNFINNTRSNAFTASYSLGPRFSVFGAFSYSSFFAQGNIVYLRGTPPLNDFLRDQEINRVWQAGVEARPVKHFGLRFSGNYDRSSGVGQITGEAPRYGPVTWPLATGTAWYDLPLVGQLAVDFQRTYYIEPIIPGNNFSANLLTIRWTKGF